MLGLVFDPQRREWPETLPMGDQTANLLETPEKQQPLLLEYMFILSGSRELLEV